MRAMSLGVLFALVSQNTAAVLLMKFTFRDGAAKYDVSTTVCITEFIKLVICLCIVFLGRFNSLTSCMLPSLTQKKLAVPAVLYTIQNNLVYVAVNSLTPASYIICSQGKIFTTAFFSVVMLSVKLQMHQYLSFILLACGMVLTQLDFGVNVDSAYSFNRQIAGVIAITLGSITSGFTGVYLEILYKSGTESIWERNLQLGVYALPIASLLAIANQSRNWERSPLDGFDSYVYALILVQVTGGLIVAGVMKYASTILKCFAVSISICLCVLLSSVYGDKPSMLELCGTILVIMSTFIYSIRLEDYSIGCGGQTRCKAIEA